jgi:mutator protein MutT
MATCAFAIIKNEDGKILLVQIAPPYRDNHKWNFPGGVIELGENIKQGLIREVLEETNINSNIDKRIDSFVTQNPENEINIFTGTYVKGHIKIQPVEILDANWFTVEEALKLPLAFDVKKYLKNKIDLDKLEDLLAANDP